MRQALGHAAYHCSQQAEQSTGSKGIVVLVAWPANAPACVVQAAGPTCCCLHLPQALAVLHKVLHIPQTLHICCQAGQVQPGPCRWSGCLHPRGGTADQQAMESASSGCTACTQTDDTGQRSSLHTNAV